MNQIRDNPPADRNPMSYVLENWNDGILGIAEENFYKKDGTQLYMPTITSFHHSNIPFGIYMVSITSLG